MAHRATVFSPNDVARLRKLATGLIEFVAKIDGAAPAKPAASAPTKKKKPTGAAAHKSFLAKQAAATKKAGKPYPPLILDDAQKATLQEASEPVPA